MPFEFPVAGSSSLPPDRKSACLQRPRGLAVGEILWLEAFFGEEASNPSNSKRNRPAKKQRDIHKWRGPFSYPQDLCHFFFFPSLLHCVDSPTPRFLCILFYHFFRHRASEGRKTTVTEPQRLSPNPYPVPLAPIKHLKHPALSRARVPRFLPRPRQRRQPEEEATPQALFLHFPQSVPDAPRLLPALPLPLLCSTEVIPDGFILIRFNRPVAFGPSALIFAWHFRKQTSCRRSVVFESHRIWIKSLAFSWFLLRTRAAVILLLLHA